MIDDVKILLEDTADVVEWLKDKKNVDQKKVENVYNEWRRTGEYNTSDLNMEERAALNLGCYMLVALEWVRAHAAIQAGFSAIGKRHAKESIETVEDAMPYVAFYIKQHDGEDVTPTQVAEAIGITEELAKETLDALLKKGALKNVEAS